MNGCLKLEGRKGGANVWVWGPADAVGTLVFAAVCLYAGTEREAEYGAQIKSTDPKMSASRTAWWKPERLTRLLWAMVACNAVNLWLAKDGPRGGFNSDAAGNGLARAFQELFVMAGASLVGVVALLFLVIRNRSIRIALLCLLALIGLFASALL